MKVKIDKLLIIILVLLSLLTIKIEIINYFKRVFYVIVLLYFILKVPNKGFKIKLSILSYCFFIIVGISGIYWARYENAVKEQMFNMLSAISVNISLMLYVFNSDEKFDDIIKWLFPIFLIYMIQSIMVGNFNNTGRFSSTGAVNQFGLVISYIYLYSLYAFKQNKYNRVKCAVLIIVSILLILYTGSRKAIINLIIYTIGVLVFSKYSRNILISTFKVIICLGLIIVSMYMVLKIKYIYDLVGYRIESLFSYYSGSVEEDLSALRRRYMKEDAIELFKKNPIWGIGLNNFKYVARYNTYAHSNYYELLACTGIIGTFLYYIPILFSSIMSLKLWKQNAEDSIILFVFFVSIIISEFSNISYMYTIIHVFIGITTGLIYSNQKKIVIKKENEKLNEDFNSNSI